MVLSGNGLCSCAANSSSHPARPACCHPPSCLQREVVSGKGQFACGAKGCDERRGLASFEVPFAYEEAGERRCPLSLIEV